MIITSFDVINIAQEPDAPRSTKQQKRFKQLIKKIEKQRQQLQSWHTNILLYQQKHAKEYVPLLGKLDQQRGKLVYLFDRIYLDKAFNKLERQKLAELIVKVATDLLAADENAELKVIYNKYSPIDFDTQANAAKAQAKARLEQILDTEIADDIELDDETVNKLMAEKAQQMREQEALRENHGQERKKTAKQLAREEKREQEQKSINRSIREIFRQLASTLHPDREPDSAERARKTELMQRVNVAYGNKNLWQLLELQMEIEQVDETVIAALGEERLQHYNQSLSEQLIDLEIEIEQTELDFRRRFHIDENRLLAPAYLCAKLEHEANQLQQNITNLVRDLKIFEQPKKLKIWLKKYNLVNPSNDAFADFNSRDLKHHQNEF
ncbi:MAG: molecular chaperone DnaJ [Herbaspirillum sp.]